MPNWGLIRNGTIFQDLANTLLQFSISSAIVFGRPGPDGGIDAQSDSGKTIYQAKFNNNSTVGQFITAAKNELVKITNYRKPASSRYSLWCKAKNWIMISNLKFNASSRLEWETEIQPLFKNEGLEATIWGLEELDKLLISYPEVKDAYFEGANRCFLSLNEAHSYLVRIGGLKVPFLGRNTEIERLESFLRGPKSFVCLHGEGGVGKTRLLFELGSRASERGTHQVLWGNVEEMAKNSSWLKAICSEKPTLLHLNEPTDGKLLARLDEQMQTSQMSSWKVMMTIRSAKAPVLDAYQSLSNKEESFALAVPSAPDARSLALALINNGPLNTYADDRKALAANMIAQVSGGLPVWISLAVEILEREGELSKLPMSIPLIARNYLNELIENQPD